MLNEHQRHRLGTEIRLMISWNK